MSTPPVSKAVLQSTVKAFVKAGCRQDAAAAALGISRGALQDRLKKAREAGIIVPSMVPARDLRTTVVDPRPLEKENERLRATIERMTKARKWTPAKVTKQATKDDTVRVFMPDSHGMYADPVGMALFLADMKRLQPDSIIMLGDHVDVSGFMAQHHVIGALPQTLYSYEEDIAACRSHLDVLQANAPKALTEYIEGNHEQRCERWCIQQALAHTKDADYLRRAFAPQFLLDLKGRGIPYFSRSQFHDGLRVPGTILRGKCFVTHDSGFGDPRVAVGKWGGPLVHGHVHRSFAHITSTVAHGELGCWSPGTLARTAQYYMHSKPSGHTLGYGLQLISRSGFFLHINIPLIDGVSYLSRLLGTR